MPPKENNIELGAGQIYFKGIDESFEVHDCDATEETEWADDKEYVSKHIIGKSPALEPIMIECKDVQIPRDWVLAECKYCGSMFPIIEFYALTLGTKGWTCPLCAFEKRMEEKRNEYGRTKEGS